VSENRISLSGIVVEREALRHTPAGIPILSFRIEHASTQIENSVPRQVEVEIDAMAVGMVAQQMNHLRTGQRVGVQGFLAKRSRQSSRVILHVNQFDIE
jgi:primosomal replication protein N